MAQNLAVRVENAFKSYNSKCVLNNLCMNVPKGAIYGLLGASGCGKTTLLNCIVGVKSLDLGKLTALDQNVSSIGAPTSLIGYMPQEVALAAEFSVQEAVYYFGKIYNISNTTINERFKTLAELLQLPKNTRLIKYCSGGEQRRVSFAIALINNPKLLILDEPTVGLDPVLRDVLWNYLLDLVKNNETAVIVTTHYIEEAIQAHRVGFMREGRLLAEDSPEKLLTKHGTNSLEQVFLILSTRQAEGVLITSQNDNKSVDVSSKQAVKLTKKFPKNQWHKKKLHEISLNWNRLRALFLKNFLQISRNIGGTFFTFLFPVISMLALLVAVGDDVKNIKIGIVNEEVSCESNVSTMISTGSGKCTINNLSCRFMNQLDNSMIDKIYFENTAIALNELNHGRVCGVLLIPSNFSLAFQQKLEHGLKSQSDTLSQSQIEVWLDISNKQIGSSVKRKLYRNALDLQKQVMKDCGFETKFSDPIIDLKRTFYGNKDDKFTVFIIPGMLLGIIFFMGVTNTADTIITDRVGGIWHRSAVAGVSSLEIILTHFVTQFFITFIQTVELLILTFFIYKSDCKGSIAGVMIILITEGICGMSYGLWISVLCKNHSLANFIATGSFYPLMLIGGVLWPLEGMPEVLQYLAYCLPVALPTISLRNVIQKGRNFASSSVYGGVGVQLIWVIILGIVCVCLLKSKR